VVRYIRVKYRVYIYVHTCVHESLCSVYVYMYTYIYKHTHIFTVTHYCVCKDTYIRTSMYTEIYVNTYSQKIVFIRIDIFIYIYICIQVYTHVYI